MPVLAVGGEQSFGTMMATLIRFAASDLLPMAKARGIPPLGRTPNALPAPKAPAYLPLAKARGITQDLVTCMRPEDAGNVGEGRIRNPLYNRKSRDRKLPA